MHFHHYSLFFTNALSTVQARLTPALTALADIVSLLYFVILLPLAKCASVDGANVLDRGISSPPIWPDRCNQDRGCGNWVALGQTLL